MKIFREIYLLSLLNIHRHSWALIFLFSIFVISCSKELTSSMTTKESKGEAIYSSNCKVCHAQGINGAPILGNKKMWSKRIHQEIGVLIKHAEEGYGLMPAKGGNEELSTEDISSAVRYMLEKLD